MSEHRLLQNEDTPDKPGIPFFARRLCPAVVERDSKGPQFSLPTTLHYVLEMSLDTNIPN
jgi:hypothetical protein